MSRTLKTLQGKVILTPAQEAVLQDWCQYLHHGWNRCVAAFRLQSIIKLQTKWIERAIQDITSDGAIASATVKKQVKAWKEDNYPLHEWKPYPHKTIVDGVEGVSFYMAAPLWIAPGVKSVHEPRTPDSLQSPQVEFYHYRHDLITPYVIPLPPRPERDTKPDYLACVKGTGDRPDGVSRYENGLVDRFKASVKLFFKTAPRGKPPRFKSKRDPLQWLYAYQSDQINFTPDGFKVPGLTRLGLLVDQNENLRKRLGGYINPNLRSMALTHKYDGWYLSITIQIEQPDTPPLEKPPIGIDMGVVHHMTTSEGHHIDIGKQRHRIMFLERKKERLQVQLSRHTQGSNRWQKVKAQLSRCQGEIARIKKAWAEQATTTLTRRHGTIFVEDLTLTNMNRKAKAKLDESGHYTQNKAAAKSGLNRSLAGAAMGATVDMLDRKAADLHKVNPKNSSRECSACGHIAKESRVSQSEFKCVACGHEMNADHNAALNILRRGLGMI